MYTLRLNKSQMFLVIKSISSCSCVSGCLLHCARLHFYEHELDVHRTGLGLRRESKWRRSLIFNHKTVRVQKAFLEEHHHPFSLLNVRETKTSLRLDPTHLRSVIPLSKERTDVLSSLKIKWINPMMFHSGGVLGETEMSCNFEAVSRNRLRNDK